MSDQREQVIHQLFERQVARSPHAPAIIFENQVLTYQQLNRQANRLAHLLREYAVGTETPVGFCVSQRTSWMDPPSIS